MTFPISLFTGKKDNSPSAANPSLEELETILSNMDVRSEKDGPLWSPASYPKGKRRSNENVSALSCLVLDFDGGHDPSDFLNSWTRWTYFVHSTHSTSADHPKWRAVFPLRESVPAKEWAPIYEKLVIALSGGVCDPSCSDEARIYYLPSCPPEIELLAFSASNHGELLDHLEFPDPVYEEPERERLNGQARPGDIYDERATWDEILEGRGWHRGHQYRGQTLWTRPGKSPREGVSAKTGPGPAGDRFYCWSSEAGVPTNKALTKFGLLSHLEYGGDYAACAKALAKLGYRDADAKPKPQPVEEERPRFEATDVGNAERLVRLFGRDLRYCSVWGKWLVWDGRRWLVDETGGSRVTQLAIEMVRGIAEEALEVQDRSLRSEMLEWSAKCHSRSRLDNMIAIARHLPGIPITTKELDGNRDLLNCLNGTVDLRTGHLHPHRREDLITCLVDAPYQPGAECPRWTAFLDRVLAGDVDLMRFVWKAVGYSLSGEVGEKCFFFLHGANGDNGKSVFVETLLALFGEYGRQTDVDTLMAKKGDGGVNNDVARLREARFVAAPETEDGRRLNEGLIKRLTGGDTITARFLHQEFFEFQPQFKIWMSGNHKPVVRGMDNAIWRRVVLIPFQVTIPREEQDPQLKDKLLSERAGILAWAVEACLAWREERLGRPDTIAKAVSSYREEMDVLGSFLDACTERSNGRTSARKMYDRYQRWCGETGEYKLSETAFGRKMAERGESSTKDKMGRWYEGRELVDEGSDEKVWRGSND